MGHMPAFKVHSEFAPAGDQPKAIAALTEGVRRGDRFQTLLGITGSGKSATIAWTIEAVQKPTLVLAPNKSLAAQLANEFKEFFPENRVEYFVSYYDYYQPEAYIPSSDTYIEKDSSINDEIDRLRHSATAALLTRRDVIVVASVSCIYGMGNPEEYRGNLLDLSVGVDYDMRNILRRLVDMQYGRNDMTLGRGNFRVRGDTIEVHPAYEESVLRIEMFGDTVDRITTIDPLTGRVLPRGSSEPGMLAAAGPMPTGYWNDEEKTAQTFRVVDGVRYTVPGDFATIAEDGTVTLLGRGSVCINSGGEKIYPEEVEVAARRHPAVIDANVVGVPHERFGETVVLVCSVSEPTSADEIISTIKESIADYKAPRRVVFVDEVYRAPNGKADYRWAREQAAIS